jgi:hypothetical protein
MIVDLTDKSLGKIGQEKDILFGRHDMDDEGGRRGAE